MNLEHLEWIIASIIIIISCTVSMISLADVQFSKLPKRRQIIAIVYFIVYLILNTLFQVFLGFDLYGDFYLLITQLPLYILLFIITKYRGIKLIFLYLSFTIFSSTAIFLSSFIIVFTDMPLTGVIPSYALMIWFSARYLKKPFYYILEYADKRGCCKSR